MTIQYADMAQKAKALPPSPRLGAIHHAAFRCRDGEETRAFYEDVLGLPLRAALAPGQEPGTGQDVDFLHLFFELGGGQFLAFFDVPKGANPEKFKAKWGMDLHVALQVASRDDMMAFKTRLDHAGVPCFGPIDHAFVHSIYFFDPNGINVEITCRDEHHDAILSDEAAGAHAALQAWTARKSGLSSSDNPSQGTI